MFEKKFEKFCKRCGKKIASRDLHISVNHSSFVPPRNCASFPMPTSEERDRKYYLRKMKKDYCFKCSLKNIISKIFGK